MRFNSGLRFIYSNMSGKLFQLSVKKGYDSVKFAELVCKTHYGHMVYDDIQQNEWLCENFLMEGFEREFKTIPKGDVYDIDAMWYVGYLYRYWVITEEIPIKKVYKIAPIEWLIQLYPFYHTQGEKYVIEDIKERRKEFLNNK